MAKKVKEPKENQEPKKKRDWKKITIIVVIVIAVLCVIGMFMPSEEKEETETQIVEAETEAAIIEEISDEYQWDAGELAYLDMSREQLLTIYNDYNDALADDSGNDLLGADYLEWEENVTSEIAEKYGIEPEDVDNILMFGAPSGYFATFDVDDVKLDTGDLVNIRINGGVIIIEADVSGGWSGKTMIESNYRNAARFIRDYVGDEKYDELQYWAIGDTTDDNKVKYISFTVPSYLFPRIVNKTIADKDLGDYVEDLWLLPSLREE